jgi:very-short-patch-repair endonuclease
MSNPGGEELLFDLITKAGLPEPERNAPIGPYKVDFLWPEHELVAEADSWTFHGNPLSFETDHRRDAYLRRQRLEVVRYTWRQLNEEPLAVIADLATTLERRRQP